MGVIPANTNWKYTSDDCGKAKDPINGMFAWPCRDLCPSTVAGLPKNVEKKPWPWPIGVPKPMWKAHRTQTTSTTAKAANVNIMLLIDQRFCMTPPYRTTSPGTLIKPTSVAAVICQALSPELSHEGASTGNVSPSCFGYVRTAPTAPRTEHWHDRFTARMLAQAPRAPHGLQSRVPSRPVIHWDKAPRAGRAGAEAAGGARGGRGARGAEAAGGRRAAGAGRAGARGGAARRGAGAGAQGRAQRPTRPRLRAAWG